MTSKAQRRIRKRNRSITLAGGVTVDVPAKQGRRVDVEDARSAIETAIQARIRLCGVVDSPEARKMAESPLAGCAVGRALLQEDMPRDHRADLWQAVQHIRRVWVAYDHAIGAPNRHAQCLRILAPTEAMTTESVTFDDRPQEERDRSAVSAFMSVQGWLGYVDNAARSATIIAVVDDAGLPNWPGIKRALECVNEGIKGMRITPRVAGGA